MFLKIENCELFYFFLFQSNQRGLTYQQLANSKIIPLNIESRMKTLTCAHVHLVVFN